MLGKYDLAPVHILHLTIEIYIIRCDDNLPILQDDPIARIIIDRKCGHTTWGVPQPSGIPTFDIVGISPIPIQATDAIGFYIVDNDGDIHSPATFTLEVQRDI